MKFDLILKLAFSITSIVPSIYIECLFLKINYLFANDALIDGTNYSFIYSYSNYMHLEWRTS